METNTEFNKAQNPAVSVVVPFYNIEHCVRYCLESLLSQTFSDYEIVCVDDGSTDNTGIRLDEYAGHPKVSVFHKKNGGVADSRNYGVLHSRGEYISFVDGDDVVSPYYLKSLIEALGAAPGGMAVGLTRCLPESAAGGEEAAWGKPGPPRRVSKEEMLARYAYEEVLPGGWCRLAPREFYLDRPFPAGKWYEDISVASKYLLDATEISFIDEPIYGYVMRPGSIVHRKQARFKQVEDYFDAVDSFEEFAGWERNDSARIYFECLHYSRIYRLLDVVAEAGREKGEIQHAISRLVRMNLPALLADERATRGNKARFAVLGMIPRAYNACFKLYERCRRGR